MNHTALMRCMGTIDLQAPDKEALKEVVGRELLLLRPTPIEQQYVYTAYDITFDCLRNVPVRQSKEAYIFHIIRTFICSVRRQRATHTKSIRSLVAEILHDNKEEAPKAGVDPTKMRKMVCIRMGDIGEQSAEDMDDLSHEEGEDDFEYMIAFRMHDAWEVIYAKLEERLDNLRTLEFMSEGKQRAKLIETGLWLPILTQRLKYLIHRAVEAGKLDTAFRGLAMSIVHDIQKELTTQKRRLGMA